MNWWWLSFADEAGFRGACIVRGWSLVGAVREAWKLGINPGGDVAAMPLPVETEAELAPYEPNRLYSRAEIAEIDQPVPVRLPREAP